MITREQALHSAEFHNEPNRDHPDNCRPTVAGPRGGLKQPRIVRVRRNGMTQTWKTRPEEFSIPVKYGLRDAFRITHRDAGYWHAAEECPLLRPASPACPGCASRGAIVAHYDTCPACGKHEPEGVVHHAS